MNPSFLSPLGNISQERLVDKGVSMRRGIAWRLDRSTVFLEPGSVLESFGPEMLETGRMDNSIDVL